MSQAVTTEDVGPELAEKLAIPRSYILLTMIFGIVFLAPWQGFLKMGDRPGHSVWHCVGSKVDSFDDLSPAYLAQAERYIPDVLAWGDS